MKEFTGVGTPASSPSRTTPPFWTSNSDGLPSIRSRCMDEVPLGGDDSSLAMVAGRASTGMLMPLA